MILLDVPMISLYFPMLFLYFLMIFIYFPMIFLYFPIIFYILGSPSHDSIRSLSYQDADVFLLCYKISDPDSLYNVKNKWIREIRSQKFNKRHQPHVVLCGCQADLRSDPKTLAALGKVGRMPTSSEQALAICCEIGAVNYVETSSLPGTISEL